VCGETFCAAIILNSPITTFNVGFIEEDLCCHDKCLPVLKAAFLQVEDIEAFEEQVKILGPALPENSPIRKVLEDKTDE
jgi:hypothetical protein